MLESVVFVAVITLLKLLAAKADEPHIYKQDMNGPPQVTHKPRAINYSNA